jgi:hypothetical protein
VLQVNKGTLALKDLKALKELRVILVIKVTKDQLVQQDHRE